MGNLNPAQNFDHVLDPISGYDGMHDLQYSGFPDNLNTKPWFKGGLLSVNTSGKLEPGSISLHSIGLFAINGSAEFDVSSDVGNISGGVVGTYPATGGYLLLTTEFNPAPTYAPNDPLIAYTAGTTLDGEDAWLTKGTIEAGGELALGENVVGIVAGTGPVPRKDLHQSGIRINSNGTFKEVYNQDVLPFFPVYCPARA